MRFILIYLCVGVIVAAAAALVALDMVIKLAPLTGAALLVGVALRISRRRRGAAAPPVPGPGWTVPPAAALGSPSPAPGIVTPWRPGVGNPAPWRYIAARRSDHRVGDAAVMGAEVFGEDDRRG